MRSFLFACTVLIFCACGSKKTADKETDNTLTQRLNEFMKANDEMNLEKVLDYTYPKIYTIAPRAEVLKVMRQTFDNDQVKVDIDSMKVDSLYPVFKLGKGSYAKVKYSMLMLMNFKVTKDSADTGGAAQTEMIRQSLAQQYGEENVRMDDKGIIHIRVKSPMVAIKDELSKEWTFVNIKEGDAMTEKMLSKELREKLATYN
ncbi:MAG TPA: hypothetical protein VMZ03_13480 [Chitinophagaceae bacterium]|nr:hypothetical protein [Chitinophagaceae bacterium]